MATAALRLPPHEFGADPGQMPALLYEAFESVDDVALRARLAAALARIWVYSGDSARAQLFACTAMELAERLAEVSVLADALDASLSANWGPDHLTARTALSARLTEVTAHASATEPRLSALLWRLTTAWECLDLISVQRQLRALDTLAVESGSVRAGFFAASRRAMAELTVGSIEEADALVARARSLGEEAGEPDLEAVLHSLAADRACRTGDRDALLAEARAFEGFGTEQGIVSVCAQAALFWLRAGEADRALTLLQRLSADGLDRVPRDVDFLLTLVALVEVGAALGVDAVVDDGARLLEPYAGRAVLNAGAVTFHGMVDDALWQARRDRDACAVRWRDAAALGYRRIGAQWWLRRIAPEPARVSTTAVSTVALLQPADDGWVVGRPGATIRLPDLRGLHHLHALLSRPGMDIPARELAGGRSAPAEVSQPVIDEQAIRAYRRRVAALDADLAAADARGDQAAGRRLGSERDALVGELKSVTGLGGRRRTFTSADERARVSVRKAVVAVLHRIEALDPALGKQLRATIRTGYVCAYRPDPDRPLHWRL